MPITELDLGALGIVEFPDGTSDEQIKEWLYNPAVRGKLEEQGYEYPEEPSALGEGLRSGIGMFKASAAMPFEMAGRQLEWPALQKYGQDLLDDAIRQIQENAPRVQRIEDVKNLEDFAAYTAFGLGSLIPSVGAALTGAAIGGLAAGPPGAIAGAFIPSYLMNSGEIYLELKAKGLDHDAAVLAGGIFPALLDIVVPVKVAGKLFWKPARDEFIDELRKAGAWKTIGKDALQSMAIEGVTEATQTAMQQAVVSAVADEPYLTTELVSDMINAGFIGAIGGFVFGGGASAVNALFNYGAIKDADENKLRSATFTIDTSGDDLAGKTGTYEGASAKYYGTGTDDEGNAISIFQAADGKMFTGDLSKFTPAAPAANKKIIAAAEGVPAETLTPAEVPNIPAHELQKQKLTELDRRIKNAEMVVKQMEGRYQAELRRGAFDNDPLKGDARDAAIQQKQNDVARLKAQRAATADITPTPPSEGTKYSRTVRPLSGFYSAAETALNSTATKTASPATWLNVLRKAPNVKEDELEWSGLRDIIDLLEATGSTEVPKSLLLNILAKRDDIFQEDIRASDTLRTASRANSAYGRALDRFTDFIDASDVPGHPSAGRLRDEYEALGEAEFINKWGAAMLEEVKLYAAAEKEFESALGPEYKRYAADDPANYTELLIKFQPDSPTAPDIAHFEFSKGTLAHVRFFDIEEKGKRTLVVSEIQSDWHEEAGEVRYYVRPIGNKQLSSGLFPGQVSGPWINPDNISPSFKTAIEAGDAEIFSRPARYYDGRKPFYIYDPKTKTFSDEGFATREEAQSKLDEQKKTPLYQEYIKAEKARKDYADFYSKFLRDMSSDPAYITEVAPFRRALDAIDMRDNMEAWVKAVKDHNAARSALIAKYDTVMKKLDLAFEVAKSNLHNSGLPLNLRVYNVTRSFSGTMVLNAPFKNNKWVNLAIKRMLRWAVENEYDAIAWPTGNYSNAVLQNDPPIKGLAKFYDDFVAGQFKKLANRFKSQLGHITVKKRTRSFELPSMEINEAMRKEIMGGQPLYSRAQNFSQLRDVLEKVIPLIDARMRQLGVDGAMRTRIHDVLTDGTLLETYNGRYLARIIEVSLSAEKGALFAFDHEVIHGLRDLKAINDEEWAILEDAARTSWLDKYKIRELYGDLDEQAQLEEAVATAFSHWASNVDSLPAKNRALLERIFNWIKNFLGIVHDSLQEGGVSEWEQLFTQIETGQIGKRIGDRLFAHEKQGIEAIAHTKFKNFEAWFGDSKVIDAFGRPLIVWHGTPNIDRWHNREFKYNPVDIGFHFGSRTAASLRLQDASSATANITTYVRTGIRATPDHLLTIAKARLAASKSESKKAVWAAIRDFAQEAANQKVPFIDQRAVETFLKPEWDFFSPHKSDLKKYLKWDIHASQNVGWNQEFMMPFFLSIRNPVFIRDAGNFNWNAIINALEEVTVSNAAAPFTRQELRDLRADIYAKLREKFPDAHTETAFLDFRNLDAVGFGNELLRNALLTRGVDGLVYENSVERLAGSREISYVALRPNQVKSLFNYGTFDWSNNDFRWSRQFNAHPADAPIDSYPGPLTAQQWKQETYKFSRTAKSLEDLPLPLTPKDMARPSMLLNSMRHSAHRNDLFARMFIPIRKLGELRSSIVNLATEIMKPLGHLYGQDYINFRKAAEISQLVPGEYVLDANGAITFVAPPEGGQGLDTPILPNEVIILRGKTAKAFVAAQAGLNMALTEVRNAWLSRHAKRLQEIIKVSGYDVSGKFDDPMSIENMATAEYKNLLKHIEASIKEVSRALKPAKYASPAEKAAREVNKKRLAQLMGMKTDIEPIIQSLEQYDSAVPRTYFPLSRFGEYFLEVRNNKGEVERLEFIEAGRWEPRALIQRKVNRRAAELKKLYPNSTLSPQLMQTSWDYIKSKYNLEASLEAAAQFLTSDNANSYAAIREELIRNIGNRGFMSHMEKRTMLPGYSTDFKRSIVNYVMGAASLAARLRYQPDIERGLNVIRSKEGTPNLREYSEKVYEYVMSPQEEWQWTRAAMFAWHLGFNMSSAFLQTMSLVQFAGPNLAKYANAPRVAAELLKATKEVGLMLGKGARGAVEGTNPYPDVLLNPHQAPVDIRNDLVRAILEGVVKQYAVLEQIGLNSVGSSVGFSAGMRRAGASALHHLAAPFNTIETASRATAFIAALRLAKDPAVLKRADEILSNSAYWRALKEEKGGALTAYDFAAFVVDENFGLYGKLNRPQYQRGFLSVVFQFKLYVHQMFELMLREGTMYGPAGRTSLAYMLLSLLLTGGLMSLPGAEDALDLYEFFEKKVSGIDPLVRLHMREMISEKTGSQFAAEMLERGFFNAIGVDTQRRISMGEAPVSDFLKALLGVRGDIGDLLGVPGSAIIGNVANFSKLADAGRFDQAISHAMPVFLKHWYESLYLYPRYGIRSIRGTQVMSPEDWNNQGPFTRAGKVLGFTPTAISHRREALWYEDRLDKMLQPLQESITNQLSDAIYDQFKALEDDDQRGFMAAQQRANEIMRRILDHNSQASAMEYMLPPTILTNAREKAIMRLNPEMGTRRLRKAARPRGREIEELYND